MSARFGMRFAQQASRQSTTGFTTRMRNPIFRRFQGTATNPAAETVPPPQNLFQRLWTSEVGIKTVHFWAPVMKWGVVLSGVSDFFRPADKLSLTQNLAMVGTGSIWTRWCFIIKPQNLLLAAVNFCLFLVGTVQVTRILLYQQSIKGTEGAIKSLEQDVVSSAKGVEKKIEEKL